MGSNSSSIHGMILKPDVSRSSVLDAIMVSGAAVARPVRGINRRAHPERNRKARQLALLRRSRRGSHHHEAARRPLKYPPTGHAHGLVAHSPVVEAVASVEVAQRRQKHGDHPSRNVFRPLHTLRHRPLCRRTAMPRRTRLLRELRTRQANVSARSFATVTRTRLTPGSGRCVSPVCSLSPKRRCVPGRRSGRRVERSDGRATMAAITSRRASTVLPRRSITLRRTRTSIAAAIACSRRSGRGTSVPEEQ